MHRAEVCTPTSTNGGVSYFNLARRAIGDAAFRRGAFKSWDDPYVVHPVPNLGGQCVNLDGIHGVPYHRTSGVIVIDVEGRCHTLEAVFPHRGKGS